MEQRLIKVAILNVGEPDDDGDRLTESLSVLHAELAKGPFQEVDYYSAAGEQAILRARLRVWSEAEHGAVDVVLTCGGTGLSMRDRMPEATAEVVDRLLPGIPQLIRMACMRADPGVAFLRLEAGIRRRTMIINLPDDAANLRLCLPHLLGRLPQAVRSLQPQEPTEL